MCVRALRLMDDAGVEAWLLHCMDIYDTRGLHPAVTAFRDVEAFAREYQSRVTGLAFEEVAGVLEAFVHGLNGRRLKIEPGEQAWTDTETLHLPSAVSRFESREENFQLYKAMVVHQWAQTWYGTWRVSPAEVLARYPDYEQALARFHALETLRLDARIRTALPGVHRQLRLLRAPTDRPMDEAWRSAAESLEAPGCHGAGQSGVTSRRHRRSAAAPGALPGRVATGRGGSGAPRTHRGGSAGLPGRPAAHAEGARTAGRHRRQGSRGG